MTSRDSLTPPATPRRRVRAAATLALLAAAAAVFASGCAGVEPWERDLHARVDMTADAHDAAIDDHIYFSKEASSGGRSFAGGGCGCN